ncbi:MAG: type II secretion system protein GspG [Desulfococcaceae bacterium]
MTGIKNETVFWILFNSLILVVITGSLTFQFTEIDPEIENKYKAASKDLSNIKYLIICYYCKNKKFPLNLKELVPETILQVPIDPWGNEYILTSLAWRQKNSGVDVLSMGGDGRLGGKGWKRDIISRIDLTEIRCGEKLY